MSFDIHPNLRKAPSLSWATLVASTAGLGAMGSLNVAISSPVDLAGEHRLVVQVFRPEVNLEHAMPASYERPVAAAQRSLHGEPVRDVVLSLLHEGDVKEGHSVLAWLEPGAPDLDYDGMRAKPSQAAMIGVGRVGANATEITIGSELVPRPSVAA